MLPVYLYIYIDSNLFALLNLQTLKIRFFFIIKFELKLRANYGKALLHFDAPH